MIFSVQVHGEGGGVMAEYRAEGENADAVADTEVKYWVGRPQVGTVVVFPAKEAGNSVQRVVPPR